MSFKPGDLLAYFHRLVWRPSPGALPAWQGSLLRLLRLVVVLVRDLASGQLTLRAMSLVYTTLLSIVPLLALSFSVLKAFGVHNQIEPALLTFLEPLGEKGMEIAQRILEFIENMNVGVLGSMGLALLIYTAVSLVQKIEESFNFIWHVSQPRSLGQRFSNYLSVLLVGPLLVFSAIGITAAAMRAGVVQDLMSLEPVGIVLYELGRLVPFVLIIGAFTFIYTFIPNTRVHVGAALAGGVVGGILWQTAGWAFAMFAAGSTKYAAIYSSFAILILFMIWIYLSWLILLVGASVGFYRQHPEYMVRKAGEPRLSNRMRERLALVIMSRIAGHFRDGLPPWTAVQLSQALSVPAHAVDVVLQALSRGGMLAENAADPPAYLPARDLESVSVKQLLDVVRAAGEEGFLGEAGLPVPDEVQPVLERMDEALAASFGDLSVRALAAHAQGDAPEQPAAAPAEPPQAAA